MITYEKSIGSGERVGLPTGLTEGARLKWVREKVLRLSLADMEAALRDREGFTLAGGSLGRYERGERKPERPLEFYSAVARLSGVPLDWLVLDRPGLRETAAYIGERLRILLDELDAAEEAGRIPVLPEKERTDSGAIPPAEARDGGR